MMVKAWTSYSHQTLTHCCPRAATCSCVHVQCTLPAKWFSYIHAVVTILWDFGPGWFSALCGVFNTNTPMAGRALIRVSQRHPLGLDYSGSVLKVKVCMYVCIDFYTYMYMHMPWLPSAMLPSRRIICSRRKRHAGSAQGGCSIWRCCFGVPGLL